MSACRWVASDQPRMLRDHRSDCDREGCEGCLPCREAHCRACGVAHGTRTCPECVAAVRNDLREIAIMCGALPTEVKHRGINGEAMMLWGPTADIEAWEHTEASYMVGRLPEGWIETTHGGKCPRLVNDPCLGCTTDKAGNYVATASHELHPLAVLAGWEMVWRDYLEHDTDDAVTIREAVRYLDMQLTYMADQALVPFGDFAKDLRRCSNHLRAVLHDQNQGDVANVGCFECGSDLERLLTKAGLDDVWTCTRCHRKYTSAEYNFALRASLESETSKEMA